MSISQNLSEKLRAFLEEWVAAHNGEWDPDHLMSEIESEHDLMIEEEEEALAEEEDEAAPE